MENTQIMMLIPKENPNVLEIDRNQFLQAAKKVLNFFLVNQQIRLNLI